MNHDQFPTTATVRKWIVIISPSNLAAAAAESAEIEMGGKKCREKLPTTLPT
jgi:hypothetical protein